MSSESKISPFDSTSDQKISGGALDEQVGGNHYKNFAIQPFYYSEVNKLTFGEGDVIKRVSRHSRGGKGLEDIEKAIHELRLIAKIQYGADL